MSWATWEAASLTNNEVAGWAVPPLAPSPYNYPGSILLTNTDSNPKSLHDGCFLKGWDLPCPKEQLGEPGLQGTDEVSASCWVVP